MIDKDGIERPDDLHAHSRKLVLGKRKLKFDENYHFYPRLPFRLWAGFFRTFAVCVFNPVAYLKYHIKITGHENKKKLRGQGYVITCSHVHVLDDVCCCANVFPERMIYFTTLENNIRRRFTGFFLRSLCGMPIPASSLSGMKKFNEDVSYILKKKKKPVMFNPEGSLWPYYREIRPFKKGAFSTAVKNDVPVLPILVTFRRKKKRNGKFKYYLNYTIGEPIYANKTLENEKAEINELLSRTQEWYVKTNKEWYENHDCGFDDEKEEKKVEEKEEA